MSIEIFDNFLAGAENSTNILYPFFCIRYDFNGYKSCPNEVRLYGRYLFIPKRIDRWQS